MNKKFWIGFVEGCILGGAATYLYLDYKDKKRALAEESKTEEEIKEESVDQDVVVKHRNDKPDLSTFMIKYYMASNEDAAPKKEEKVEEPIKVKGIAYDEFGVDENYDVISLSYHDYIDETGERVRYLVDEVSGNVWSEEDVDFYFGDWDVIDENIGKEEEDTAYIEDSSKRIYYEIYRADPDYEDLDY